MHQLLCQGVWIYAAPLYAVPGGLGSIQDKASSRQNQVLQIHIALASLGDGDKEGEEKEEIVAWGEREGEREETLVQRRDGERGKKQTAARKEV